MFNKIQKLRSKNSILSLVIGNSLGISVAVASVTISALAAQSIGWQGMRATLPYGGQFLFSLLATLFAPSLMDRFGRKAVFQVAAFLGLIGGVCCGLSLEISQPLYLLVGHCLIGVALAAVNLFRFAALDIVTRNKSAESMSLVVFGGSVAAFLGPSLVRYSNTLFPKFEDSSATYLGMSLFCGLIGVVLTKMPAEPALKRNSAIPWTRYLNEGLDVRSIGGIFTAAVGYGVMNLLMVSGSISMSKAGFLQQHITTAIQLHVLAMFVPSIFIGHIMARCSPDLVVMTGAFISLLSMVTAAFTLDVTFNYYASLALAGLAWNMLYVGGSFIATNSSDPRFKYNTQSLGEFGIGVFAVLGAFLPGVVISKLTWEEMNSILILPIMAAHLFGLMLIYWGKR